MLAFFFGFKKVCLYIHSFQCLLNFVCGRYFFDGGKWSTFLRWFDANGTWKPIYSSPMLLYVQLYSTSGRCVIGRLIRLELPLINDV